MAVEYLDLFKVTMTILSFLFMTVFLGFILYPTTYTPPVDGTRCRVVVLVLGDIGRSPRMQYHALSLAEHGFGVELIGYNESPPRPELLANKKIIIHSLSPTPGFLSSRSRLLFPFIAPLKVLHQVYELMTVLLWDVYAAPAYILVQNPPSIPTLIIAKLVAFLRGSKLVIDWHNFGYTILGMKLGSYAPLVVISKAYEHTLAHAANVNFTVTDVMATTLKTSFNIKTAPVLALHDRPPAHFQPLSASEQKSYLTSNELFKRHLSKKPKLLVSSTSWTPDEDFSILLAALEEYKTKSKVPLLVVITGKGPLLAKFTPSIDSFNASAAKLVTVVTVFLRSEDYPKLLACADLGVCLHTSSSGIDLPMKVVDMFGCGVPVAAVGFRAIGELVKDGVNGVVFDGKSGELGGVLVSLLGGDGEELGKLKEGAIKEGERRWAGEWDSVALPVFEKN